MSFLRLVIILVVIDALTQNSASAQHVRIFKDPRLDALVGRPAALKAELDAAEAARTNEAIAKVAKKKTERTTTVASEIVVGKKIVTGSILEKDGFRVVIYNGADKPLALKVKNDFTRNYPGHRSYLDYNRPNYRIKVGDFDDKKDAVSFMKKLTPKYPAAFLLPDKVTVKNIIIR